MGGRSIDSISWKAEIRITQKISSTKTISKIIVIWAIWLNCNAKKSDQKFCSSAFRKKLKGFIHQKGVRDYILIDGNVIVRDGDEHPDVKVRTHGGVLNDSVWKVSSQSVWEFVINSIDCISPIGNILQRASEKRSHETVPSYCRSVFMFRCKMCIWWDSNPCRCNFYIKKKSKKKTKKLLFPGGNESGARSTLMV